MCYNLYIDLCIHRKSATNFISICKAFFTTLKKMTERKVTINYPNERIRTFATHRGMHTLDKSACVSCKACAVSCPNECICIKESEFLINYNKCCFCGNCVATCHKKALKMTNSDIHISTKKTDFIIDLTTDRD